VKKLPGVREVKALDGLQLQHEDLVDCCLEMHWKRVEGLAVLPGQGLYPFSECSYTYTECTRSTQHTKKAYTNAYKTYTYDTRGPFHRVGCNQCDELAANCLLFRDQPHVQDPGSCNDCWFDDIESRVVLVLDWEFMARALAPMPWLLICIGTAPLRPIPALLALGGTDLGSQISNGDLIVPSLTRRLQCLLSRQKPELL
jgi:hypothetical protein